MNLLSTVNRIILVVFFLPLFAFGQASLKGTITDVVNNETLIGVNVVVVGTSLGSATDIEGQFRIVSIPARVLNVKFSCIGYEPQVKEIDFSKTNDVVINIQLKPAIIQGEEVVVTAQMRGQIAAINQQVTSNRIVNVVSEEKIQELPDANAAEAIGRLPGVSLTRDGGEATGVVLRGLSSKFSNITLDGVRIPPTDPNSRNVDMSMLSQGSLSGIELYKTLTSDQDADAIAGGINLVTRKAPSERLVRVDVKGDYNHLMKSAKQYDVSARYGERFFDDRLGIQLQGNFEQKIRSKEEITYTYNTATDDPLLPNPYNTLLFHNTYFIQSFDVRFTDETRKRNGMQVVLDYNTPDSGSVKLVGMLAKTDRDYMMYERSYLTWFYTFERVQLSTMTRNIALEGNNYLLGMTVNWNASFAESGVTNPNDFRTIFYEAGGGSLGHSIKDHPEQLVPVAKNIFASAFLDSSDIYRTENYDKELTLQLNLSKTVRFGDLMSDKIKIGGKYKTKSRWMNNYGFGWNNYPDQPFYDAQGNPIDFSGTSFAGAASRPALSRFVDMTNVPSRDLLGIYTMTPLIDINSYQTWEDKTKDAVLKAGINFGVLGMLPLNDYFVTERVSAAYFMNSIDIGQSLTLILGVRAENENNDYEAHYGDKGANGTGNVISLDPKYMSDTTAHHEELNWLPNAQMSFRPTDFLTVRAAAYEALARPDFILRLPQFSYSAIGSTTNIFIGNPELKNTSAWNFEANTQIYSNTIGLFTVSAFYKRIENLFHQTNRIRVQWINDSTQQLGSIDRYPNFENNSDGFHRLDRVINQMGLSQWLKTPAFNDILHKSSVFTLTAAYNSPDPSYTWGFELEHQMNFGFLPVRWLQNITLTYNVTIMRSQTNIWLEQALIDTAYTPTQYNTRGRKIADSSFTPNAEYTAAFTTKPMEDQPELYGNAALGYDIGGFSARISMFYQGRYTRSYSMNGTSDQVVDEFVKWDLSLKQQLSSKISMTLNVNNIFNRQETKSRYNNKFDWGYLPTTAQLYGTTIDFGVRVLL